MHKILQRPFAYFCSFLASMMMSGCVSGGFSLTRSYAHFVNGQRNPILRVVIYILTGIIFAVTLLIDMVVYNTLDFWDGRVSAGDYKFQQGERTYYAHHEIAPGTHLKSSVIRIHDNNDKLLQTVALQETTSGEIEMFVDGVKRCQVKNISDIPIATTFDQNGAVVATEVLAAPVVATSTNNDVVIF